MWGIFWKTLGRRPNLIFMSIEFFEELKRIHLNRNSMACSLINFFVLFYASSPVAIIFNKF